MRHGKKGYKLGRTQAHRRATLAALSSALIEHKRIRTTMTKAKALRMFVEPIITRAKEDTMQNRRQVFRHLQNKHAVKELFGEIADKVGDRNGGYTRVIKLGQRSGDGAEMAIIELVDYNDVRPEGSGGSSRRRTRRSRRRGKGTAAPAAAASTPVETTEAEVVEPVEEEVVEATAEEEVVEEAAEEVAAEEAPVAEVEAAEEPEAAPAEEAEAATPEASAEPAVEEAPAEEPTAEAAPTEEAEAADQPEASAEEADESEEKKDDA